MQPFWFFKDAICSFWGVYYLSVLYVSTNTCRRISVWTLLGLSQRPANLGPKPQGLGDGCNPLASSSTKEVLRSTDLSCKLSHTSVEKGTVSLLNIDRWFVFDWKERYMIHIIICSPQFTRLHLRCPMLKHCKARTNPRMGRSLYSTLSAMKYWPLVSSWVSSGALQNLQPAPYLTRQKGRDQAGTMKGFVS